MELLLEYLFFSTIEFAAGICLMLAIFRFPIRDSLPHIIIVSLIVAQASFIFREIVQYPALAPIIQLLLMSALVWLMFRVQIFYAVIMVTISYILMAVFQLSFFHIGTLLNIYTLDQFLQNRLFSNALQIINSLVAFILCLVLSRKRIGFSFVPDNEKDRFVVKGANLYLIISVILSMSMLIVLYNTGNNPLFSLSIGVLVVALLFYLAIKKERLE
jgi:hypothetical protein